MVTDSAERAPTSRERHTIELKVFSVLTLVAVLVALLGLAYQEPVVFFAGLAFALFAVFGVLFALAKVRRWLF